MADQVLMRVALRLQSTTDSGEGNEESARIRAGVLDGALKEVNTMCYELERESVRRTVCRVSHFALRSRAYETKVFGPRSRRKRS